MVLHDSCSAPGPWSGSTGEMISSRSGNNTRELCCIWRSRRLYSQPNCSLYCTLYCCRYYCYSFHFSFLPHSFTKRTYARSLTLIRTHTLCTVHTHTLCTLRTHTLRTVLYLKGATPLLQQWQRCRRPPVWKYFGFPVSYVDNICVVDKKATVCKLCRN